LAACVTSNRTPTDPERASRTEARGRPPKAGQQQKPVKGGRTSPARFHFALRFATVALARTSDSLVRVSRRADRSRATSSVLGHHLPQDGSCGGHIRRHAWCLCWVPPTREPRFLSATGNEWEAFGVAASDRRCPANGTAHHNRASQPPTTTPVAPTPTHLAAGKCARETTLQKPPPIDRNRPTTAKESRSPDRIPPG